MPEIGILLVSHVREIGDGVLRLLKEVAGDVTIKAAAGTEDNGVGTSFDRINETVTSFEEPRIWAFYDLGSAKMNLDLVSETTDKNLEIQDVSFVEGAYVAAAMLQANASEDSIHSELKPLKIK
ncbi:phosphoenolpyruvate-dihydroxyacetone phosphotransferase [Sporolactobacillus inulinus]|uniref:phosphoenolpyruvate--glycerone phosphotransferase n=1 Tax=Sporolactobacillus inulinus TaxID=2078 RepID=A0A4Y1Z8P5_9BACL|nr:dihydroxyacetone kinase phosphoryl donor subunit DhaM [Sporolactobacillus inulinus]GAY75422.1 phosphoenolpyruvate-dihydroxyacetone phosphotransferase [Sporolactobacillus inulinus]